MGFFDFLKPKKERKGLQYIPRMDGGSYYKSFGDDIYASDIIIEAIRCKAVEFQKLKPRHTITKDGKKTVDETSDIARLLRRPNPFMTTADFLSKITILLEINKNVFIYPDYVTVSGKKKYTGIYPLKPTHSVYVKDEQNNVYLELTFANGMQTVFKADEIIHWRKDYGVNDFFGGGLYSLGDDKELLTMLQRYDELQQSIAKALKISCQINGMVKYNTYKGDDKLESSRGEFLQRLKQNDSGILFTDLSTEYVPITRDIKIVDDATLKFYHETILRSMGVSLPIFNGDFTKEQKEAFYEHSLEADIISLGQAFTKTLFTDREENIGHEITFYPDIIKFMTMEQRINALKIMTPAGAMYKDEIREVFGLPPLPNGQGQVIAQGYNNLLDENNNNTLKGENNDG